MTATGAHMEAFEVESQETKATEDVLGPKQARLNKYALACALLASTNSILLGYGKCNWIFLS